MVNAPSRSTSEAAAALPDVAKQNVHLQSGSPANASCALVLPLSGRQMVGFPVLSRSNVGRDIRPNSPARLHSCLDGVLCAPKGQTHGQTETRTTEQFDI
jgi:hypothetical protein